VQLELNTYSVVALAIAALTQALAIAYLCRSVTAVSRVGARVTQLASALELLTDTTEAGLTNVASELERAGTLRRLTSATTRRATAGRIASAARQGRSVEDIATTEAISESEVRLHMQMIAGLAGERDAALRV
jgi:DNA-binding NarL/FixJ family response regulator